MILLQKRKTNVRFKNELNANRLLRGVGSEVIMTTTISRVDNTFTPLLYQLIMCYICILHSGFRKLSIDYRRLEDDYEKGKLGSRCAPSPHPQFVCMCIKSK